MFRWLTFALCLGCYGCKSAAEPCQRQVADCLKRCDASGADPNPPPGSPPILHVGGVVAPRTMSVCEENCQRCRSEPPPKPLGPPTPTGNAP